MLTSPSIKAIFLRGKKIRIYKVTEFGKLFRHFYVSFALRCKRTGGACLLVQNFVLQFVMYIVLDEPLCNILSASDISL